MKTPYHVTNREQQILDCICRGMTAQEISSDLHIARSTVENHKKNLCNKFNARNSAHLAAVTSQLGIVSLKDKRDLTP